jgi:hypothetical protein
VVLPRILESNTPVGGIGPFHLLQGLLHFLMAVAPSCSVMNLHRNNISSAEVSRSHERQKCGSMVQLEFWSSQVQT